MSALIKYDQARQALAACRNVDDIKDVRDKSEAMRLYAKQANDTELEQWAAEIKLRAQRAIGELSAALEKQTNQSALPSGGKSKSETLADAGISTSAANRYEKLAAIADSAIEAFIAKSKLEGKPVSVKSVMATLATKEPAQPPAPPAPAAPRDHDDAPDFGIVGAALPAPVAADDSDDDAPDPFELLREEQARAEQLQDQVDTLAARVKLLSQGDLAAQLIALELDRDGIRNRAAMHYEEFSKANNKVIELKKLLDKLRKIAGVTKYTDLASRISPVAKG
jgi:cell division protein FtsB